MFINTKTCCPFLEKKMNVAYYFTTHKWTQHLNKQVTSTLKTASHAIPQHSKQQVMPTPYLAGRSNVQTEKNDKFKDSFFKFWLSLQPKLNDKWQISPPRTLRVLLCLTLLSCSCNAFLMLYQRFSFKWANVQLSGLIRSSFRAHLKITKISKGKKSPIVPL